MAIDPVENVGKKNLPALPYDQNNRRPAALVIPQVSAGEVVGYLPARSTDNGDGTATLKVDTEFTLDVDTISLTNLKVGSTDQTAANSRFLKTESDGTVHTLTVLVGPSDVNVTEWGGTAITGADITPNIQNLDAPLSTLATEATLASIDAKDFATETTLAGFRTDFGAVDFATETTLSSRATEATALSILGQLDVALSTRASEATLLTIAGLDFATETTLALIKAQTDQLTFNAASDLLVQEAQLGTATTAAVDVDNSITPATLILAANAARKEYTVVHEDPSATVYIGFADTVTTLTGIPVVGNQMYGSNKYTGDVYAVASVAGPISVRVAEVA